jgi:hypothetical protein
MTITVLDENKTDQAANGRFFSASEQLVQAAHEAYEFTQSFHNEYERLFRKLGSRMLVRAALLDGGKLVPWQDYPNNPTLRLILDARKSSEHKYTWEISRFDPGIGTHINQLGIKPSEIEAGHFSLDTKGNFVRHRKLGSLLAMSAMTEVRETAVDPLTQDYMEATFARLRSPLPTGDHTDMFPYQVH